MTGSIARKGGIPALVYSPSEPALQRSCSLLIKHSGTVKRATISLQSTIHIYGFDDEQTFILIYNADNLVTASLGLVNISLPQSQLTKVARNGNPQIRTLSLTIKKPCPIQCPPSSGSIAPKSGFDACFHQLVRLARATEICILFDYNWIHVNKRASFENFVKHPEELSGFPVPNHAKLFRLADWTVFSPVEDALPEAPPSYTNASKKRPRQATTSLTPKPPHQKRVLRSRVLDFAPSPTEKATTASTPSSIPSFSSVTNAPNLQESIKNEVELLLPKALEAILSDMIPRLFAIPPSSPSLSSPSPSPSPPSLNMKANLMSSLRTLVSDRVAAHAEDRLEKLFEDILYHAQQLRDTADLELTDILDDHKADISIAREDGLEEVTRLYEHKLVELRDKIDEKLEELKESAEEIVITVEKRAEDVYANVSKRLVTLVGMEREMLERDRKRFEEEKQSTERNAIGCQRKRAISWS